MTTDNEITITSGIHLLKTVIIQILHPCSINWPGYNASLHYSTLIQHLLWVIMRSCFEPPAGLPLLAVSPPGLNDLESVIF